MSFERIKKIKGHEYKYLVKSVRVDGKVKQVFIKYLGNSKKPVPKVGDQVTVTGTVKYIQGTGVAIDASK